MTGELEVRKVEDPGDVMAGVVSEERGEYRIPDEALVRLDSTRLEAWSQELMAEARRRGLRLNIERDAMLCVTVVRWRPDQVVGEVRASGWSS